MAQGDAGLSLDAAALAGAPTALLHDHLDGGLRPATVLELADEIGWRLPATDEAGVFIRQPPVKLPSGRLLLPTFYCVRVPGEKWLGNRDYSAVMLSDDGGATWSEVEVPQSTGCVHMNIGRLSDGTLVALFRSRWADAIYRSVSTDDGQSWSAPQPTELPNNNSSIQFVVLPGDRLALVFNQSSAADATARRLSLYDEIDDDGGVALADDIALAAVDLR